MDQAIGSKIADYLIKPVNPSQILLALKKNIHQKEIVTEVAQTSYQQQYQQIAMQIGDCRSFDDWKEVYKKLVRWELELSSADSSMMEMLRMQKEEANNGFGKFIQKHYLDWIEKRLTTDRLFPRKSSSPKSFLPLTEGTKSSLLLSTTSVTISGVSCLRRSVICSISTRTCICPSSLQPPSMHVMPYSVDSCRCRLPRCFRSCG